MATRGPRGLPLASDVPTAEGDSARTPAPYSPGVRYPLTLATGSYTTVIANRRDISFRGLFARHGLGEYTTIG